MAATIDRPTPSPTPEAPDRSRSRLLKVMVAVLAVVVLALGAVVLYELASGDESAMPADVQQVLDDYYDAWETEDRDALRALVTDDVAFVKHVYKPDGGQYSVASDADRFGSRLGQTDYTIENFDSPIVTGDGPWFVSVGESWISVFSRYDGTANYMIVEEDGALLIARHHWVGHVSPLDPPWAD